MSSSSKPKGFFKKGSKVVNIPGTKPSIHNNSLLVSCGVPSLDALLGGGIAVGTCLLIDEDKFNTYSGLVFKYYLAEGVTNNQSIFVASSNQPPSQIVQDLPQPISHMPKLEDKTPTQDSDLSIAWRYKNVPTTDQGSSTGYGHYYDVTKVMSKEMLAKADITTFDGGQPLREESATPKHHVYCNLLNKLKEVIEEKKLSTSLGTPPGSVLRIAISSLGSPYWSASITDLTRFLFSLRALLRSSFSTCLVTVPSHLFQDLDPLVRCSDSAVKLISFSDNTEKYSKNPAFKDYHGLVNLLKLPRINSLVCTMPDTMDWVFKLKRKKLTIEKMHLPPDLSETVSRDQEDPDKKVASSSAAAGGCGVTRSGVNIDF